VVRGRRRPLTITIGTLVVIGVLASATYPFRPPLHERFPEYPQVVAVHVALGGLYLALAPLQLVGRIRSRWPTYHRWAGRLLVATGLVSGGAGLFIAWVIPFAGWPERIILGFFGLLFALSLAMGFRRIRAAQVAPHREWMLRAFAIGLAIATDRVIVIPAVLVMVMRDAAPTPTRDQLELVAILAFTIAFTLHTVLAEVWIRATRRRVARQARDLTPARGPVGAAG
jgi:uncharacterized membrane protein